MSADERQHLLSQNQENGSPSPLTSDLQACELAKARHKRRSISLQILLICIFRTIEPMFFNVIVPYINQMLVYDLKVSDEIHVGYYAGKIESAAAVGMCLGVFFWAYMSDKIGRRPVILFGVFFSCILCAAFGFARKFWLLVLFRFLMGFGISAQSATSKVMISELSPIEDLPQNFVYFSVAWQVGGTTGPAFGGVLSRPAHFWPNLFSGTIFETFPHALPTLAVVVIPAICVAIGFLSLHETGKFPSKEPNSSPSEALLQIERPQAEGNAISRFIQACARKIQPRPDSPPLFSCGVHYIIIVLFALTFQAVTLGITELLFLFSPRKIGGLGLTQAQIAIYCVIRPLGIFFYEMLFYIKVARFMGGTIRLLKAAVWIYPIIYLVYLGTSQLALSGQLPPFAVILALGLTLTLQIIANSGFVCAEILLTSRAPEQEQLSTITAIAEIIGQCAVGLGAIFSSSLFADSASLDDGFFRYKLVWIISCVIAIISALITGRLTHIDGWKERQERQERQAQAAHTLLPGSGEA